MSSGRRIYNGGMDRVPPERELAAIGLLQDPVRRALYGHVVAAGGDVSRNQAAEAVGVQRSLAAFHLDKLVEAGLLAEAVDQAGADLELQAAARRAGQAGGRDAGPAIEQLLEARGYEPYPDGNRLRLRNCPFAHLAHEFPVLVCSMNLALVEGLLEGIGKPAGRAVMDPAPGRCCVAITSKDNQD